MILRLLLVVSFFILFSFPTNASHRVGYETNYQKVGQDSFIVTFLVYRDCSGIKVFQNEYPLRIKGTCGITLFDTLKPANTLPSGNPSGVEVSQLCSSGQSKSNCSPSSFSIYKGYQKFTYQSLIVLDSSCHEWDIFVYIGQKPPAGNFPKSSQSFFSDYSLPLKIRTGHLSNNSLVYQAHHPVQTYCTGQQVDFSFEPQEPDKDSIVYSFVNASDSAGNPITYKPPYSANSPYPGIQLDSATGKIQMVPTLTGAYSLVIQACEYERSTKLLKGCTTRDVIFYVANCSNQPPVFSPSITVKDKSFVGSIHTFCIEKKLEITTKIWDSANVNALQVQSNIQSLIPGASLTTTQLSIDTLMVKIKVNASGNVYPDTLNFFLEANDDVCPNPAFSRKDFQLILNPSVYAIGNTTICEGTDTLTLSGFSPTANYQWNIFSGDTNYLLPCDTCSNTTFSPDTTSFVELISSHSFACQTRDTVKVNVNYSLPKGFAGAELSACRGDTLQLMPSIPSNCSKNQLFWKTTKGTQAVALSNDSITRPTLVADTASEYVLFYEDDCGVCPSFDTVSVFVWDNPQVSVSDQRGCEGWLYDTLHTGTPKGGSYTSLNFADSVIDLSTLPIGSSVFWYQFTDTNGCYGVDTAFYQLDSMPETPIITQRGDTLLASDQGSSYRWYQNGTLLSDTSQWIIGGPNPDRYKVAIVNGTCESAFSPVYTFQPVGISERIGRHKIEVFPNPNGGNFTFTLPTSKHNASVLLRNQMGQTVWKGQWIGKPISVSGLSKGVYFLSVNETISNQRIVVY